MPAAKHESMLLIHGDERHLVDEAARHWRAQARSGQLDVEIFDAPARLTELRRSVAEVPLLDPERSILVRDAPQLTGASRRGADSAEELATIVQTRPPTTAICLVVHARVPEQNAVLKAVRGAGGRIAYFARPRGREVRTWIDSELARRGLRLGAGSADRLVRVAGSDLGALSRELDKLEALAGGKPLSADDVRRAVAGDEPLEMWVVLDGLLGPSPAAGAAALDRLLGEGRSSQHLLAILAGQVRDLMLAQAHVHLRGSPAGLATALRIPEWRAERLARQARAVPPSIVAGWLRELHEADRRVKAGELGDQDALRTVALRAADAVTGARAGTPR